MTNQPLGGNEMPRFAGPNTFMRLPSADTAEGLDVAFVGVPPIIMTLGTLGAPTIWEPARRPSTA